MDIYGRDRAEKQEQGQQSASHEKRAANRKDFCFDIQSMGVSVGMVPSHPQIYAQVWHMEALI